jgi:hypothetical protein
MKKMFMIAVMMIGLSSFAQEKMIGENKPQRPERGDVPQMPKFTAEQKKQLEVKKLTLALDLNSTQQKEMEKIISEQSAKREAKMAERKALKASKKEMTADELFALENNRLDEQIAVKAKVKKVLSAEQFDKWEKMKAQRHHKGGKKFHKKQFNGEKR